jgi:Arsenical resistance operon protein ArsD
VSFDLRALSDDLRLFTDRRLLSEAEAAQVLEVVDEGFAFAKLMNLADSIHVHVNVDSLDAVPGSDAVTGAEDALARSAKQMSRNEAECKIEFSSGLNVVFATEPTAQDELIAGAVTTPKPYVDHLGVDLRDETDSTRAAFDSIPSIAGAAGWRHVAQDGPVNCCHVVMGPKHWVYPPATPVGVGRPIEFAFGALTPSETYVGCDYRPIDPAHPLAGKAAELFPDCGETAGAKQPEKIYIFEECTCNTSPSASLLGLLRNRYGSADVRAFDLAKPEGLVPLPPALFMALQEGAAGTLPAIVVDGRIRAQGWTPNFMDLVKLIDNPELTASTKESSTSAAGACCSTDGSCC